MLGLKTGAAGGPAVEKLALNGNPKAVALPVPMQKRKDCDFSYAGLKNAFRLAVHEAREAEGLELEPTNAAANTDGAGVDLSEAARADLAASFQYVAIRHLEQRLRRAMDWCDKLYPAGDEKGDGGEGRVRVRDLAVVGGVAANQAVRASLRGLCEERSPEWRLVAPPPRLCTDNGVMVAWAAIEKVCWWSVCYDLHYRRRCRIPPQLSSLNLLYNFLKYNNTPHEPRPTRHLPTNTNQLHLGCSDPIEPENAKKDVRARWPLGPFAEYEA